MEMIKKIKMLKSLYEVAKKASVGEVVCCPSCGTLFEKTNYQQAFCKTKGKTVCKDNYWNNVTPTKRNNKTRISPASRRFMEIRKEVINDMRERERNEECDLWDAREDYKYWEQFNHPFSSDALGQY